MNSKTGMSVLLGLSVAIMLTACGAHGRGGSSGQISLPAGAVASGANTAQNPSQAPSPGQGGATKSGGSGGGTGNGGGNGSGNGHGGGTSSPTATVTVTLTPSDSPTHKHIGPIFPRVGEHTVVCQFDGIRGIWYPVLTYTIIDGHLELSINGGAAKTYGSSGTVRLPSVGCYASSGVQTYKLTATEGSFLASSLTVAFNGGESGQPTSILPTFVGTKS